MGDQAGDKVLKQPRYQRWILTGLLIRLVLMPFTFHGDLLAVYYRAYRLLEGRSLRGLGPNVFNIVHAGFLWLMRPLLPYATMWVGLTTKTNQVVDGLEFVNRPLVFRSLFLFKLPYLGIEVLVVWMLMRLTEPDRKERVLAFWMLNPIVIFSVYIFGRFDMITVFLLLSALYLAKGGRHNLALAVLAAAALIRVYPMVLVLPFALILEKETLARLKLAVIGLAPTVVSIVGGLAMGKTQLLKGFVAKHLSYPLAMKFYINNQDNLYIFIFLYSLLLMYLYVNHQPGFDSLKKNCFYVFLLFFATSYFHPHYLMWLVPFAAFYFDEPPQFLSIYWLQVGAWVIYAFQWGRDLAGLLLSPLSPAFFWSVLSPSEWIDRYFPTVLVIGMGRSLFSATCLTMAYMVWRRGQESADKDGRALELGREAVRP